MELSENYNISLDKSKELLSEFFTRPSGTAVKYWDDMCCFIMTFYLCKGGNPEHSTNMLIHRREVLDGTDKVKYYDPFIYSFAKHMINTDEMKKNYLKRKFIDTLLNKGSLCSFITANTLYPFFLNVEDMMA